MTPYAQQKIREALAASKGNRKKSEDMVRAMALDDARLLGELMGPHLAGVIAHAVARVAEGKEDEVSPKRPDKPVPVAFPQDAFGRDLVRAITSKDVNGFGMPQPKTLEAKPKPASKQHVDAIKALASKTISKDKK